LNLVVVRFYGVSPTTGELRSLKELNTHPIDDAPAGLVFAEDPSGFIYIERGDGSIVSFDTRSGKFSVCADGLDDFVCEFLFGVRGGDFMGEDWLNDRKGGLIA
jgi:hypothetical protein